MAEQQDVVTKDEIAIIYAVQRRTQPEAQITLAQFTAKGIVTTFAAYLAARYGDEPMIALECAAYEASEQLPAHPATLKRWRQAVAADLPRFKMQLEIEAARGKAMSERARRRTASKQGWE